jgi:hypothetical protein
MALIKPPGIPRMPDPASVDVTDPVALKEYLTLMTSALTKHIAMRAPTNTALPERLMLTPGGKTYALKVLDDGSIVAEPFGSAQTIPVPTS